MLPRLLKQLWSALSPALSMASDLLFSLTPHGVLAADTLESVVASPCEVQLRLPTLLRRPRPDTRINTLVVLDALFYIP